MGSLMGLKVDSVTLNEALRIAGHVIESRENEYFTFINIYQITLCNDIDDLMDFYNNSRLSLVEGMTAYTLSKLKHVPVQEKIPGTDFIAHICNLAAQKKYKVFFLGGEPGKENIIKEFFQKKYKNLEIVGVCAPPYGFENSEKQLDEILGILKKSEADIVFVGLGSPKQDRFIKKYKNIYNIPLSLPVGSGIDILTGRYKRAPKWMSQCGLEWLYRCFQEPKRLFKRYAIVLFKIAKLMVKK